MQTVKHVDESQMHNNFWIFQTNLTSLVLKQACLTNILIKIVNRVIILSEQTELYVKKTDTFYDN